MTQAMLRASLSRLAMILAVMIFAAGSAQADWRDNNRRDVVFENRCEGRTFEVLILFSPRRDTWITGGWYIFEPGERARLVYEGAPMKHRDGASLHAYAISTSGDKVLSGDLRRSYRGETYQFQKLIQTYLGPAVLISIDC